MNHIRFVLAFIVLAGSLLMSAARPVEAPDTLTVSEAFMRLPHAELSILPPETRRDMLDYMEADSIAVRYNVYMGKSWIEKMTPDYMRVHLTDASSLELKMLPSSDKKNPFIAMSIYTIGADEADSDSTIKFFSSDMKPLNADKYFKLPDPKLFYNIPKDSPIKLDDILEEMPFYTIRYSVSEADPAKLKGTLTISEHLTQEQRDRILPLISPELEWIWDGKKFKYAIEK